MKNQTLFSSKDKSKKIKCRLLQYLFAVLKGLIRLNVTGYRFGISYTCTALRYEPAFIATW